MGSLADLRIKISAVADAIRSKLGIEDGLTLDEMAAAIDNIGGSFPLQEKEVTTNGEVIPDEGYYGLSKVTVNVSTGGSSSAGIDGGYTVNFYDINNKLLASHSTIYGYWTEAPMSHQTDHWENENGAIHLFPLVVTEDMGISVVNVYEAEANTCDYILYNYFGVDRGQYPYIFLGRNQNIYIGMIYFATHWNINTISNGTIRLTNGVIGTDFAFSGDSTKLTPQGLTLEAISTLKASDLTTLDNKNITNNDYLCINFTHDNSYLKDDARLDTTLFSV